MKRTYTAAAFLFLAAAVFIFFKLGATAQLSTESKEPYAVLIPHIKLVDTDDFYTRSDKVRHFIYGNSIHKIDEEFHRIWGDHEKVAQRFLDRAEGRSVDGPHLECSSRSGAMKQTMKSLGYRTRGVSVYRFADNFRSHVFLEVQNPKDGTWHVQDPDYDIFWRIIKDGRRASIDDLIRLPQTAYEPCLAPGRCGWGIVNSEHRRPDTVKGMLGLAILRDKEEPQNDRMMLVNTARFDLEKKMSAGPYIQTYCDFVPKNCRGRRVKY